MVHICDIYFLFLLKNVLSFNIDTNFPIVYVDPNPNSTRSTYFGYSAVLYPGKATNSSWILIGSPRGQNLQNNQINSGLCYKCGIKKNCNAFLIEEKELTSYKEKVDDAWIGGSIDINYEFNIVVTCGFRSIRIKKLKEKRDFLMQGTCYWFYVNDNTTQKIYPAFDNSLDMFKKGNIKTNLYLYGHAQSGFSVHLPLKENQFLLGAPGVYNWEGSSILLEHKSVSKNNFNIIIGNISQTQGTEFYDFLGYSSTSGYFYNQSDLYYVSGSPRAKKYRGEVLIYKFISKGNPLDIGETRRGGQVGEYFGASVTSGDINGDRLDDLIVGAPMFKAKEYNEGKIYIFMGNRKELIQLSEKEFVIGKKKNGHFGLTVQYLGDIDHDGFGDIAVSAPYEEDSGVVYIFLGSAEGLETAESQRIVGKDIIPELRGFGVSISRSADIDGNKFSDVAIGAYRSGHTVLLRTRPSLTIYHRLESAVDRLTKEKNFSVTACFWYELNYSSYNISITRTLLIDKQLERADLYKSSYNATIALEKNGTKCETYNISLKSSVNDNRYAPITITLAHHFEEEKSLKEVIYISKKYITGKDSFCSHCPVYNKYKSSKTQTLNIPFALDCQKENICEARLGLDSKITNLRKENVFVLGSGDEWILETTVKNVGDMAYSTQLEITVQERINFQTIPKNCEQQNLSSILCNVAEKLDKNDKTYLNLTFDVSALNKGNYDLLTSRIVVKILKNGNNTLDNQKTIEIKLQKEANVIISGKSGKESYFYKNTINKQLLFDQTYQIENFGPSSLYKVSIEVNIPHIFTTKNGKEIEFMQFYKPNNNKFHQDIVCKDSVSFISDMNFVDFESNDESMVDGEHLKRSVRQVKMFNKTTGNTKMRKSEINIFSNRTSYINCSMSEIKCSKFLCTAESLENGQIVDLYLKMVFNISAMEDVFGKKEDVVLFASHGIVNMPNEVHLIQSENQINNVNVFSLFIGEVAVEQVNVYTIVISTVVGLFLFFIIILGLVKCGFFQRKKREELELLKKEMKDTSQEVEVVEDCNLENDLYNI